MGGPGWRLKRILASKALFLVSLAVLLFFSFNLAREIINNRRDLEKEIKGLEDQMSGLAGRNQELSGLIEYFKTNDFVEEVARTKLNLKKEGEKIIIVPEEQNQTAGEQSEFAPVIQQRLTLDSRPNPVRWWQYFFKNE